MELFPNTVISKNRALYRAQRGYCYLCGKSFIAGFNAPYLKQASVDHVRPRVRGHTRMHNKLLAHIGCNTDKGERQPHPCELLYLEAINEMLVWEDWRKAHG
jgi:5-methylcytosine-specific restriction endonuclease McrA